MCLPVHVTKYERKQWPKMKIFKYLNICGSQMFHANFKNNITTSTTYTGLWCRAHNSGLGYCWSHIWCRWWMIVAANRPVTAATEEILTDIGVGIVMIWSWSHIWCWRWMVVAANRPITAAIQKILTDTGVCTIMIRLRSCWSCTRCWRRMVEPTYRAVTSAIQEILTDVCACTIIIWLRSCWSHTRCWRWVVEPTYRTVTAAIEKVLADIRVGTGTLFALCNLGLGGVHISTVGTITFSDKEVTADLSQNTNDIKRVQTGDL